MPASKRPLYAVLHLTPEASSSDIARAYRRLALQFHPDRDPNGTDEFKRIANAYAVLSDVEQRRLYDATGLAPGGDGSGSAADATTAATPQERSVALASQLRAFFATYAGSDEEADDVAASYAACDGDFARMLRHRLVFDNGRAGEVQRLYALTRRLIETAHRLTATAAWTRSTTPAALRKLERAMAKERAQAEEALREMGLSASTAEEATHDTNKSNNTTTSAHGGGHDTMLALQSMMQQRQRSAWANMVADLEDKYVKKTKPPATARQSSRKRSTRDADAEGNTTTSPSSTRRAKRQKQSASRRTRTSAHDVLMTAQRDKASVPPPPPPPLSSSASCASPSLLHARDKPVGDDDDDVDAAATTTAPPLPPAMASLLRELRAQQASAQDTAAASEAAVVKLGTEADDGTHVDLTEHASSLLQPYKARRQSSSSSSPRAAGGGAVSLLSPTERAALTRLLTDAMCSEYARQQQQTAERAAAKDDEEDDGKGSSSSRHACRPDKDDDDDDKTASPAARVDAATRDVLRYQASMELHWLEEWAANSHSDVSNSNSNNSSDDGDAALAWRRRRIKRAVLERAELHKPLAYILGSQPFFGCDIACAPPLLCPRTETELWVQWYVTTYLQPAQQQEQQQQEQQQQEQQQRWWRRLMKWRGRLPSASSTRDAVRVLDMCCGTGCIGVAVAKHVPGSCIVAADVDEAAVRMTRHNAQRNGIADERMTVLQSDMFAAFMQDNNSSSDSSATTARRASAVTVARPYAHSFDAVLCNPPYILPHEYDSMPARVRRWETRLALVGDAARVWRQHSYFQELCEVTPRLLKPRSRRCAALRDGPNLCVEVGTQAEVVARLFEQCGRGVWGDVQLHLDATQQPRWLTASLLH